MVHCLQDQQRRLSHLADAEGAAGMHGESKMAVRSDEEQKEQFVQALTASQGRLRAYIFCLIGDMHDANTILQETNLVLWRKVEQFPKIRSFIAWSREVAYFQTLAFLRDRKRDKLIFSQDVIDSIVAERDEIDFDEQRLALRDCLEKLDARKRQLLHHRYSENEGIAQIAKKLQRTEGAIKMSLKRIRLALMDCVNKRVERTG